MYAGGSGESLPCLLLKEKDRAFENVGWGKLLLESLVILWVCGLLSLAGAAFVSGLLGDIRFLLEMQIFRGVKLTFVLPLVLISIVYIRNFPFFGQVVSSDKDFIRFVKKFCSVQIRLGLLVGLGLLAVVGYVFIGRSGNNGAPVPGFEIALRRFLENVMYARPREKEFLFGHPAVLLTMAALYRKWPQILHYFLIVAVTIGQGSMVETFAHMRSPYILSFIRGLDGLAAGSLSMIAALIGVMILVRLTKFLEKDMANYKIVISGYYGFNNAGDEAMLSAILQALNRTFHSPDITVISGSPQTTAATYGVHTVPRFSIGGILRAVFSSDLIISGGGSLLQDVTSWKSMIYYLSIITLGVLFRKQVFLYSQGIGPVRYRVIRIILKHVLNHVDAITVRDKESKGFLQRLGVRRKIYTTADAVLSLAPADLSIGRRILREKGIPEGKKKIGIAIRYWHHSKEWMDKLKSAISRLAAKEDAVIVCIPMQYPEDEKAAESMNLEDDRVYFLDDDYSIEELMSIIGNMDVLLGMRLHALIFSALMHVPFLGISYDPKIDNFLALIGQKPSTSVQHMDGEKLYNDTCRILFPDLHRKTGKGGRSPGESFSQCPDFKKSCYS